MKRDTCCDKTVVVQCVAKQHPIHTVSLPVADVTKHVALEIPLEIRRLCTWQSPLLGLAHTDTEA